MKEITKLLKKLSSAIYDEKGYVEHKTYVSREKWSILRVPSNSKKLGARKNLASQHIEIFEEGAINPSYVIPLSALEDGNIAFTKCKECGNLAIFNDVPNVTFHIVQCIEKPPFHNYVVKNLSELERL